MDMSLTQAVNILETFNLYQYRFRSWIFAPTISTSFDFHSKGEVDVYRSCANIVQITMSFFWHDSVTLVTTDASCMKLMGTREIRHNLTMRNKDYCKSWNMQVDESLGKICHYHLNVPQHYYLLDTLVYEGILFMRGQYP